MRFVLFFSFPDSFYFDSSDDQTDSGFDDDRVQDKIQRDGAGTRFSKGRLLSAVAAVVVAIGTSSMSL